MITLSGIGMHTEIKDPDDKIILSRVYNAEGKLQINQTKSINMLSGIMIFNDVSICNIFVCFFFACRPHFVHIAYAWRARDLPLLK